MSALIQFPLGPDAAKRLKARADRLPADPANPPPRALGRLAPHQDIDPDGCPYPEGSPAAREWLDGWAEGFGIPKDAEGRVDLLVDRLVEVLDGMAEIRAIAEPEVAAIVDRVMAMGRRPRGNLVPLQVSL
jgi:hypothetical protein